MNKFIKIPVTKVALSHRKPVYGIGINDATYQTTPNINGKKVICPYYDKWVHMLRRAYCDKTHKLFPTYKNCSVCDEWLIFSNFRKWMKDQDWIGNDLDKDIIKIGNKIYSPENCVFVDQNVNYLLLDCAASRGKYPIGVCWDKEKQKFLASCRLNGKNKYLGRYSTPEEASSAYKTFKYRLLISVANKQVDHRIKNGLLIHAENLLNAE